MITKKISVDEQAIEDRAKAQKLMDEGWSQKSRKYRRLGRVPGGISAIEYMKNNHPDKYRDIERRIQAQFESECRAIVFHFHEEYVELSESEFDAWLQLRRESGDLFPW